MNNDTGSHYRKFYKGFQIDPARICKIYETNSAMITQIVKKALCCGQRGHKDKLRDLDDIICAANREKEMVLEDLMPSIRVDHVMVRASSEDCSEKFYCDGLGMDCLSVDDRLSTDGYKSLFYGFHGHQGFKIEVTYNPEAKIPDSNMTDHIAFYVDDIELISSRIYKNFINYETSEHEHGDKKYKFIEVESPEKQKIIFIQKGV